MIFLSIDASIPNGIWAFFSGTWVVKDIRPAADGKPQKVKVKVRINLHGIMTVSSASLIEAKEATETESPESEKQHAENAEQQQQQQQNGEQAAGQQGETDLPMEGAEATQQQSAEVGSGTSWTKKISSWFSGVRILMLPAAGAVGRDPFQKFISFWFAS